MGNRGSKKAENSQEMLGKATFRNILEDFGKFWDILKKANLGRSWKKQEEKVTFLREKKDFERFWKILESLGKSWKKQTFGISWEK